MDSANPYLILGIGNSLLSDDGAGVHAARILQAQPPAQTTVVAVETDFLGALPYLERCEKALVIDAMDVDQSAGSVYYCRDVDLEDAGSRHSLHGLGLLRMLEFIDPELRPEVHILGIQPARIEFASELSPEVATALPRLIHEARRIVDEFQHPPARDS